MSATANQGEPAFILIMVLVLFGGLFWVVWRLTGDFWMDHFFRWMRFVEFWTLNLFTHNYDDCLFWLRYADIQNVSPTSELVHATHACFGRDFLENVSLKENQSVYQLSTPLVVALGIEAEYFYRWLIVPFLLWVFLKGVLFSPAFKFSTRHSLESLITTQAKMWPVISPIVKFNPSKSGRILGDAIPDKLPHFAEALSPEEWLSWNRIPVVNGIPERDAVRRAFIHQLGPRWSGSPLSLPVHMRALLAAFVLKGIQKREESDNLMGRIAEGWSPEHGFRPTSELVSEVNGILKDPDKGGKILPVMDRHAWRTTAFVAALEWARANGGVLAPAQFLWLRAEDRALWYPLNNLGRRAFHSEGAGAMAHYMAEKGAKKALPIPRVDTAVVTLNTYLNDPEKRTVPIPPRQES